ncbi:NAD-dependent protein deacylase [soil metagenome]
MPIAAAESARIFVLTGAGISAESGIRTFRDNGGMWEQYRFEEVASPEGWARDAALVWRFYSERRAQAATCAPNAAHRALADLERKLGDRLFLCTQNVDPLHERGGSKRVVHMHGELMKTRCERSPRDCATLPFRDDDVYHVGTSDEIPRCVCGGRLRPHICWFGEVPFAMDEIAAELARCDVFVTIGSSGAVYPAAGFVRAVASRRGTKTYYVGPEAPDNESEFDECIVGRATEIVPSLFG